MSVVRAARIRGAANAVDAGADRALRELYETHYHPLVRLAALLTGDVRAAQDVVQESFAAMHGAWPSLRAAQDGVPYLRRAVVRRSRAIAARSPSTQPAGPQPAGPQSAGPQPVGPLEPAWRGGQPAVVAAIAGLPARQREALVLRLYLDLPDEQIAAAMGTSAAAARNHASRAMAALRNAI